MNHNRSIFSRLPHAVFLALVLGLGFAFHVQAQVFENLFSFSDARNNQLATNSLRGIKPSAAMVRGADGNFYGTTENGGTKGLGTVFRMTPAGVVTTMVDFTGFGDTIGTHPQARLLAFSDGSLYGTTASGGSNGFGTIFRISLGGVITKLVDFNAQVSPHGGLTRGGDGNLYGTTITGGFAGVGTVFKMTPGGTLTTTAAFGDPITGVGPNTSLISDSVGNFYGTTAEGGVSNCGTIFKTTPGGLLTTLVEFVGDGTIENANRGQTPSTDLIIGADGNFYGTTAAGGATGAGTVFKMTPAGVLTTLSDFPGLESGAEPTGMVLGSDGNFYITTKFGGGNRTGSILKMTPAGVMTELFPFGPRPGGAGASGVNPAYPNGLVLGSDGNFYGSTQQGGDFDSGTLFRITPLGVMSSLVGFSGTSLPAGQGLHPVGGLVAGDDGNFYGTTGIGGADNLGTFFRITPNGVMTTLANVGSFGSLVKGIDGAFYGFFEEAGNTKGRFSRMTSSGVLTRLGTLQPPADFINDVIGGNTDSINRLVRDEEGNFYGTTQSGGAKGQGSVFMITPGGEMTTLVEFEDATNGLQPGSGLVQGADGNFYGTTLSGGEFGGGTFFQITPDGNLTTLLSFDGIAGIPFNTALTLGPDGNFYGQIGDQMCKITPAGELADLGNISTVFSGALSICPLVFCSDGNFYGKVAVPDGTIRIFKMVTNGTPGRTALSLVYQFFSEGGLIGESSGTPLVAGADGNLYGALGGVGLVAGAGQLAGDSGSLFRLVIPRGAPSLYERDALLTNPTTVSLTTDVNARGGLVSVWLEYGTDGVTFPNKILISSAITGFTTTLVGTTLSGLDPATDYSYRFRAASPPTLYGTTAQGGAGNSGTVFELSAGGDLTTLVDFTRIAGPYAGSGPNGALVMGSDGNFYGTTSEGGDFDKGTAFRITPAGLLTTLVGFTGIQQEVMTGGSYPHAGLVMGSDGNFYGTTYQGGVNDSGTVFKMTPAGAVTPLVEFTNNGATNRGENPEAALILGGDGNFYGTTRFGGTSNNGTVFKMTPDGVLTTLVEFTGIDGTATIAARGGKPTAALITGDDGNFYGTTSAGGANDDGTVFRMTPAGVITTLVDFSGTDGTTTTVTRGSSPRAALVKDGDGSFYGTTSSGGETDNGTVFKITPTGVLTILVDFTGSQGLYPGALPDGELAFDSSGNLYGSTRDGGANGAGTLFKMTRAGGLTTLVEFSGNGGINRGQGPKGAVLPLGGGTTVGAVRTFSTGSAPMATPTPATAILGTSAQFNGTVRAFTSDATVIFEWGTDGINFPNTVPAIPGKVSGSAPVAVKASVAGLGKGGSYFYRIVATNLSGTTVSGQMGFVTLAEPVATVGAPSGVTALSATLNGTVNPLGVPTSVEFEYGTSEDNLNESMGATPTNLNGNSPVAVTAKLIELEQNLTYFYRVKATSSVGVTFSSTTSFSPDILSGFSKIFPDAPPSAEGFVQVVLTPPEIGAWRFTGEPQWRPSGIPVSALASGDRTIEFRPEPGYIQPLPETVSVASGGAVTRIERVYFETSAAGRGELKVTLKPESLASGDVPQAGRAQWRLLGENDTQWRDSDTILTGLVSGIYLVECKPVEGRATPTISTVLVEDSEPSLSVLTYFLADALTGAPPGPIPFETVSTDTTKPYAHVGQIRSNVGSSSGFVVKQHVVATAGHVVFDDGTLAAVTGLQWLFQRHSGTHEPKPQIPRGYYRFDGYSDQRIIENTPGTSLPLSQNRDVAALYFFGEDAGRAGYSGFLASDADDNEFLLSGAKKVLVGYPVEGVSPSNQGRMHATPEMNATFTRVLGSDPLEIVLDPPAANSSPFKIYTTPDIHGKPGMAGGPLCVQFENGEYYPAAIYLGGTGQTVVRSIDSKVIELFNRAEVNSNTGENNTGGGITHTGVTTFGTASDPGSIKVTILPAAAASVGRWGLKSESTNRSSGSVSSGRTPGEYILELTTISGFDVPTPEPVLITGGQLREITYTYTGIHASPTLSDVTNKSTKEDTATTAIALTVGDVDTDLSLLTLSGTSNNTTLIPDANIVFGGSGGNRTMIITPAANQSGSATLTVTVDDGVTTTSDTFVLTVMAVNDKPTISDVTDKTTIEDITTPAISFNVGDVDTSDSLTLSGISSNTALVPNANIVFGGSGTNRTVTLTPVPNTSGFARISIKVSDGIATTVDTFVLAVTAVNDAPTITDITDKATLEDVTTLGIACTLRDVDTDVTSLTLSGTSSNTTLVPNANIVFAGSGAKRTVKITPAANRSGKATISLTANDGADTITDTFVLTVTAVNDKPTITDVTDKTTIKNTATAAIAFKVGDVETAAASLTLSGTSGNTTLVPNARIVFGGTGANRKVTITPAADRTGTATITLRVSDGAKTTTDTFVLSVTAPSPAPLAKASLPLAVVGSSSGIPSVTLERIESLVLRESAITVELIDGLQYQALTITKPAGGPLLKRAVEVSPNLLDWYSGQNHTTVMQDDDLRLKVRDNIPLTPGIKRYIRFNQN